MSCASSGRGSPRSTVTDGPQHMGKTHCEAVAPCGAVDCEDSDPPTLRVDWGRAHSDKTVVAIVTVQDGRRHFRSFATYAPRPRAWFHLITRLLSSRASAARPWVAMNSRGRCPRPTRFHSKSTASRSGQRQAAKPARPRWTPGSALWRAREPAKISRCRSLSESPNNTSAPRRKPRAPRLTPSRNNWE